MSEPDDERRARARKQSTVLGALFAVVALLFYLGTRVFAPGFVAHFEGGEGTVTVNGVESGRTGELIEVGAGDAAIRVLPDSANVVAEPDVIRYTFNYAIEPVEFTFRANRRIDLDEGLQRSGPPADSAAGARGQATE
ncbi:MAG: hypothetical protein MAG453_00978 [Calditrichaeota bacterium]|nr:hypothetical protein [Calditrichota bacterium]